jgi:transcriptional regulator with XRE-family HTH domain
MARKTERADEIDKHIGRRIREQRENLGMTQGQLAQAISVSYQQIHKYEHGANRISAGRLWLIAEALKMPVQFFYEGMTGIEVPLSDKENRLCLELARQFRQINNMRHREALLSLVRVLVPGIAQHESIPA